MKTQNTFLYVLRLALTLFAITAVVAAALAGVNSITKPIIDQQTADKTQEAIMAVLPGGFDEELTDFDPQGGMVSKVYKGAEGYALEVNPTGFDNTITMMVGVDNEGKVLGISVVSHTETAGLGAVAAANTSAGEAFRAQFVGKSGSVSVSKDGGEIDSITGATITSRAVSAGVNGALACVESIRNPGAVDRQGDAIAAVLPGGFDEELTDFDNQGGLVTKVYKGAEGYALEVTPAGFKNTITMMVGVDNEGKVLGISVISHAETAGFGSVAAENTEAGEAFRAQFVGQSGSVSVSQDGGQIDAITGATVTSRAVCDGVNAALACVAGLN